MDNRLTKDLVVAPPAKGRVPRWAVRMAAMVVAFDTKFDPVIKGILSDRGLPVDQKVNWDVVLNGLWIKHGIWPHNEALREESIQEALFTVLVVRHTLQNWDPNRARPKEGQAPLTPAESLSAYLGQWFDYYCTEKGGARYKSMTRQREMQGLTSDSNSSSTPNLWEDLTPDDGISPEDAALEESDAQDFSKSLEHFLAFVRRTRPPKLAENISKLIQIIRTTHSGAEVSAKWAEGGYSDSYLRATLNALRDAFRAYRGREDAPQSRFLDLLKGIPQDLPKAKAPKSDALVKASSLDDPTHPFVAHVLATLQGILDRRNRTAKPEIIQESVVYVRLGANEDDPRFMDIAFFAQGISDAAEGGANYRVEVGDWETDRGLNEGKIRKQLSSLVFPAMRDDILEEHRALLEKIIYRLRGIVWENACDYFQVPLDEKARWQNVIKLDVQKFQDLRVRVIDKGQGDSMVIAAALHESSVGRKSARSLSGEENLDPAEQTDFAPMPDKTASAPGHAYETSSGATVCRSCAKAEGGAPAFSRTLMTAEDAHGRVCTRCFAPLGRPVTAGRQEPEAIAAGKAMFDPSLHGEDDEPALTWVASALKDEGLKDDADNVSAAVQGFVEARNAHFKPTSKESSMSNPKFASLKRLAAESPEQVNEAIEFIKGKLSDSLNNLTILQENLGAVTLDANGQNPKPVEGDAKFASFKRIAEEKPELMEQALGEFYGDMDEVMAFTENLADHLDLDLPTPGEPKEGIDNPEDDKGDDTPEGDNPESSEDDKPEKSEDNK